VNVRELRSELLRRRVYERAFVLDGLKGLPPAEGAVYVGQVDGVWEVGVQERGRREAYASFPDEAAACAYALEVLDKDGSRVDRPWWLKWL
jgi:hypothetical protein